MSWYLVLEVRLRSVGRHGGENLALQNLEVSVLPQGLLRVKEEKVSLPPSLRETAPHGHSLGDPESLAEILWQESRLSTDTPDPPGTHRRQHTEGGLIGEQTSAPILFGPVAVFCTESMGRHIQKKIGKYHQPNKVEWTPPPAQVFYTFFNMYLSLSSTILWMRPGFLAGLLAGMSQVMLQWLTNKR